MLFVQTMSSVDNQDEDPFDLIQKGNAFEAASDHWRSAEFYTRASKSLRSEFPQSFPVYNSFMCTYIICMLSELW